MIVDSDTYLTNDRTVREEPGRSCVRVTNAKSQKKPLISQIGHLDAFSDGIEGWSIQSITFRSKSSSMTNNPVYERT